MAKKIAIELTSAVVIGGKIKTPKDNPVFADTTLAKNLLHRGKANLSAFEAAPIVGTVDGVETEVAPLDEHTVPELKEIAAEYEIDGAASMNKAQLIEAIQAAEEGDAEEKEGE